MRLLALVIGAVLLGGCPAEPVARAPTAASARPAKAGRPVVLAIVVDQLAAWVADERIPHLPPGGFFARMKREGTWVHMLRYSYATTDTAPGHASLHTGRIPAYSGLVMNEVIDEKDGAKLSVLRDPSTKLVTPHGIRDVPASSAARLRVPTIADRLLEAHPRAKVISVSLKDRGSLLPGGHRPTHAIYFEAKEASFVTTTAVEEKFPAWAVPTPWETTWRATDADWLAKHAGIDAQPGEGDLDGLGTVFPHTVGNAPSFRASPMSDSAVLEIALAGAIAERDPNEPLLLLVSLSASDIIGHTFGPDSWESWDQFRKLDVSLAHFLEELEARFGEVGVVLAGDHGTVSMPETRKLPCTAKEEPYGRPLCVPGARLEPKLVREDLERAAEAKLGKGPWITGIADGYVFFSAAARALPSPQRATLVHALEEVLGGPKYGKLVERVYDARDLLTICPRLRGSGGPERPMADEPLDTLTCRSWTTDAGAGDLYVVPAFGSFWDNELVPGKGTSHGTPWLHDRTVPFFARGRGVTAGAELWEPVGFEAYSAVYASFLGLDSRSGDAIIESLTAHARRGSVPERGGAK